MISLILISIAWGISKSQNCPDSINVTTCLSASNPLLDSGDAIIICTITGILRDQMEYYWWLIDDSNTPIYTFSDVYKIDEVSSDYKANVIAVDHTTQEQGRFVSAMHLRFDKQQHMYRCEFVLKDYSICYSKFSIAEHLDHVPPEVSAIPPTETFTSTRFSLTSLSSSSSDSNEKPTYHQNVLTDYPIFSAVTVAVIVLVPTSFLFLTVAIATWIIMRYVSKLLTKLMATGQRETTGDGVPLLGRNCINETTGS